MNQAPLREITEAEVAAFARDGGVCLRGVFARSWIDLIASGIEKDLANPGPHGRVQSDPGDPGFFFTDYYMWHRISEFRRFAIESPGGEVAARLLRSQTVHFFYDGLFVKEPGTLKPSMWHQDQPYYPVDGRQVLIIWTPVDPVPRESCLEIVRGSHLWGKWFAPVLFKGDRPLQGKEARFVALPDIDRDRGEYDILSWSVEPGDCIAFHGLALHGARGNEALDRRRRALSTTWLGDDAMYGPRPGELEPHFQHLDYRPGERLDDETVFPRVWPRAST